MTATTCYVDRSKRFPVSREQHLRVKSMLKARKAYLSPIFLIICWCVFNIAMVTWWVIFYSHLIVSMLNANPSANLQGKQHMLLLEGVTLVLLLLLGAAALIYYVWQEEKSNRRIKQFFSAFTHELKTPIASLRLQAESLQEDLTDPQHNKLVERLLKDTERLELRLENSLYLTNLEELGTLHMESVDLNTLLRSIREAYTDIDIVSRQNCTLTADIRALELVLKNIVSNAINHGAADTLLIECSALSPNRVALDISDNGNGFSGNPDQLGQLFTRHSNSSGTGMGLFLIKSLVKQMNGSTVFTIDPDNRLITHIELKGRLKSEERE